MKLRHFLVFAFMLLWAGSAFCADTLTSSGDPGFDAKLWVAICGALGTLTTMSINVGRWIRERSSSTRRLEAFSSALKLKDFLDSEDGLRAAVGVKADSEIAANSARGELSAALRKLDASPGPMSTLRRCMLFYSPRGWRAWLAHSLFYATCIFFAALIVALFLGEVEDLKVVERVIFVLAVVLVGILLQRWAALEYRISNNLRLSPRGIGGLFWYPANNRYGFLAQTVLVLGIVDIASLIIAFLPVDSLSVSVPSPTWELVLEALFRSAFLPIGYYWAQTEFSYSEQPNASQARNGLLRMMLHTGTVEQLVGSLALVVLTVWNIILLFAFRAIPMDASFPDTQGFGEMGITNAVILHIVPMVLAGWLPWLAVYRGLWALYGDGAKPLKRLAVATEEDLHG